MEGISARFGDGTDDTAHRTTILGIDTARLDLHFLEDFEDGVLARAAGNDAVRRDAVNVELVFCGRWTIHLKSVLELARVDGRRECYQRLKRARLRQTVKFFCRNGVFHRHAAGID